MNAFNLLNKITGNEPDKLFGEPLADIFTKVFNGENRENIVAVAYICALYISFFKEQFPLEKLRVFQTNIRESHSLFFFDCKSYDSIMALLPEGPFEMCLIDRSLRYKMKIVSRQDIYGALDFYTNQ